MASLQAEPNALTLHMARLYEQSPLFVALFDASDTMRYANGSFSSAFAVDPAMAITWGDLMRRSHALGVGACIKTPDIEAWITATRSRRGKLPYRTFEADLTDGRWIYMTETVDEQGWMLCVAFDISSMRVNERSLRLARDGAVRAAQIDTLTGISNRKHILEQLDERLAQRLQSQQPCGLVMLDLDHFKRVNDTYGHHGGDLVLTHFARMVAGTLRREDGFGRIGGEEFMLLFPNIAPDALEHKVTRVLESVRQDSPLPDAPEFRYSSSAGLTMLDPMLGATENIRQADEALYAAKAQGRNRLVWSTHSLRY